MTTTNGLPQLVTGPLDQLRDPRELLESVRDQLWAQMYKTLREPASREGQHKYLDYERAKDIVLAILDLMGAERSLAWLTCEASYHRINLGVTDEDLDKIDRGLSRTYSRKPVDLELERKPSNRNDVRNDFRIPRYNT